MAEYLWTLRETHDDRLQRQDGNFGVEDGSKRYLGEGLHEKDSYLHVELLVVSDTLEEFKVEDVETCRMIL